MLMPNFGILHFLEFAIMLLITFTYITDVRFLFRASLIICMDVASRLLMASNVLLT